MKCETSDKRCIVPSIKIQWHIVKRNNSTWVIVFILKLHFTSTFVLASKYTYCHRVLCFTAWIDLDSNVSHEWRFEKERNFIYWKLIDYWIRNNIASICIFSSNFMKMHFVPYFILMSVIVFNTPLINQIKGLCVVTKTYELQSNIYSWYVT